MAKPTTPAEETGGVAEYRDVTYTSADGLQLHARDYGDRLSPWLPVVCLPGLTRTTRDFDTLAHYLATQKQRPRRVVAFDYRGRGKSAWDRRRDGYNPVTETNDIFDGMAALNIPRAVIVGTSRGGIIGMIMGTLRPASVAALVLNDIGPAVEARGLARIKTYVGRTPVPDDWADAARIQKRLHGGAFTTFSAADWDAFARLTYADDAGTPKADYDPALAATLAGVEFDQPIPAQWNEFRALKDVPMLAIRGENSDLLSAETLAAMAAAHPAIETITVPDEGHPPMLRGPLLPRIAAFVARIEGAPASPDTATPREMPAFDLEAP